MSQTITVDGLHFVCDNDFERYRAQTLLEKEPGTIAWLNQLEEGDSFYDIGANIGCYTLYAARRVGPTGHVYAIEPHVVNAAKLMVNVLTNQFHNVAIMTFALGRVPSMQPFFYRDVQAGSSGSQLAQAVCEGQPYQPVLMEMKSVHMLDEVLRMSTVDGVRQFIKIDVDGHEFDIILGAKNVFHRGGARSVQIETNAENRADIGKFMQRYGFQIVQRHFTSAGAKAHSQGVEMDSITDNTIFERVAVLEHA